MSDGACPACGRPVAIAGKRCLYCGQAVSERAPERPEGAPDTGRFLLALDLAGATAETLARSLGLSHYEAGQRARRGGYSLLPAPGEAEAAAEALRLGREGLRVFVIPEKEVREGARPVTVHRGSPAAGVLRLGGPGGPVEVRRGDPILVVRGEITRARQATVQARRTKGPLEAGLRIHLHRLSDPRPLEFDPLDFGSGDAVAGSTHLDINRWLSDLFPGLEEDTLFRHEPPALAPAAPGDSAVSGMAQSLRRAPEKGEPLILDNLGQFRFYSSWRGAVARRRRGG